MNSKKYIKRFNKNLTDEQAEEYGKKVLRLLLLAQPIPFSRLKEKFKDLFIDIDNISSNQMGYRNRFTKDETRTNQD